MKYIITETQADKLSVMRRLPELERLIQHLYPFQYPCDFNSLSTYMMSIKIEMFETLTLDWFKNVDNDVIWDIVTNMYSDDIVKNYTNNCKRNK